MQQLQRELWGSRGQKEKEEEAEEEVSICVKVSLTPDSVFILGGGQSPGQSPGGRLDCAPTAAPCRTGGPTAGP